LLLCSAGTIWAQTSTVTVNTTTKVTQPPVGTFTLDGTGLFLTRGSGTPNGVVTANPGSLYLDTTGALWIKTTGTGNTGWTAPSGGGVPTTRTLTINGTTQDLSADRTWSVGTVTNVATTSPITGGPITGTGTIALNVGVDHAFTAPQSIVVNDANSTFTNMFTLGHNYSPGGGTTGLGPAILFQAESSTTIGQDQAQIRTGWVSGGATHGTLQSFMDFSTVWNSVMGTKMRLFPTGSGSLSVGETTDPGSGFINSASGYKIGGTALTFSGGSVNQVLTKNSSTNYDWAWTTPSGTGTVTSFSAGDLSPLFTTTEATVTTTPALTFNLSNAAANTVFGNNTGATAAPAFQTLVDAQVPDILTLTRASNLTTNGFVKTGSSNGTLSVDTSTYLTGNETVTLSGDVTGSGTTSISATIPGGTVTYAKMQDVSAASKLLGRGSAAGAGDPQEITLGTNLTMTGTTLDAGGGGVTDGDKGDITVTASGATWTIDNDVVTDAKLRNSAATSVIGRAGSGTGDPADIAATVDSHVLQRSGGALVWANLGTATLLNDAVTYAKIQNVTQQRILGRQTGINGDCTELSALPFALFGGDVTSPADSNVLTIGNDTVTYAKMQNVTATSRFLGRITTGAGDPEELTGTQATTLLDAFTSGLKGLAPASGGGTTNFLRADGTWADPALGGGGVTSVTGTAPVTVSPTTGATVVGLNVGVDHAFSATQSITVNDATSSLSTSVLALRHNTTGTPSSGLGTAVDFFGETDTTVNRQIGRLSVNFSDVTEATRSAYMDFLTIGNAVIASKMRLFPSGGLSVNDTTDPGTGYVNATAGFKIGGTSIFPVTTANGGAPTGGSTGQVLAKNSATNYDYSWTTAGGASPGGSSGDIQYNNAGAFGGVSGSTAEQHLISSGSGWTAKDSEGIASLTSTSGAIDTTETVILSSPALPANRLQAGTVIRVTLLGTCTSTTSPGTGTFRLRWGTAGTTADAALYASPAQSAATSGTNVAFKVIIEDTIRTTGATGTTYGLISIHNDGVTGLITAANSIKDTGTSSTVDTTLANGKISATFVSSAAGKPVATFKFATIEFVYK
jgi:hypothetical protein